jgi:hypothetical protein
VVLSAVSKNDGEEDNITDGSAIRESCKAVENKK